MMTKTGKKTAKPKARAKPVKAMAMPKIEQAALAAPYTQEQMLEVCRLVKGATSVELKLSVPASGHRATTEGIGFDPVEAEPRQAFFFDTPDLALSQAGVVVRARRLPVQGLAARKAHFGPAFPGQPEDRLDVAILLPLVRHQQALDRPARLQRLEDRIDADDLVGGHRILRGPGLPQTQGGSDRSTSTR